MSFAFILLAVASVEWCLTTASPECGELRHAFLSVVSIGPSSNEAIAMHIIQYLYYNIMVELLHASEVYNFRVSKYPFMCLLISQLTDTCH